MECGYLPTPRSRKDFSLAKVFGVSNLDLPDEFDLGAVRRPVTQGQNLCTSEALAEDASDEFGIEMDSNWQAGKISLAFGQPIYKRGTDMRKAMDSGRIFGFLPKKLSPFSWEKKGEEFICAWENWPRELDELAAGYRRAAYFNVLKDSPYDAYDTMRTALHEHGNRILVGMPWYQSFNSAKKGFITRAEGSFTWHAVTVKGWGKKGMKVRSWSGTNGGDKSYYYFPRSVWNECFAKEGAIAFMYRDVDINLIDSIKQRDFSISEILLDLYSKLLIKVRYGMAR
jgi:hypothetical protein